MMNDFHNLMVNSENKSIESDDSFFDDDIEMVRTEFLSDINEPAISFNNCHFYVNMVCINKMPDVRYVQLLINKTKNQIALLPCSEDERDSFLWKITVSKNGRQKPRHISAPIFSAMLFEYMGWDINYRYKILGKIKDSNGIKLIVFELSEYRAFSRNSDSDIPEKCYFPDNWKNQFGMPYREHSKIFEVSTFKEYATISINNQREEKTEIISEENEE